MASPDGLSAQQLLNHLKSIKLRPSDRGLVDNCAEAMKVGAGFLPPEYMSKLRKLYSSHSRQIDELLAARERAKNSIAQEQHREDSERLDKVDQNDLGF